MEAPAFSDISSEKKTLVYKSFSISSARKTQLHYLLDSHLSNHVLILAV